MITIPLMVIAILYLVLLAWVGFKLKRWPTRIAVLLVMLSPLIYWVGSYQYVQYVHNRACAREGGLKVFIQPESSDRIRLDSDTLGSGAESLLHKFSPQLAVVEAWDGKYNGQGKKTGYFAYSIDPATTAFPKKDWKFTKVPLAEPTAGLYVLSQEIDFKDPHKQSTKWELRRTGKLYASWTLLYYLWSTNSAVPIGWQCFGPSSSEWQKSDPPVSLVQMILK